MLSEVVLCSWPEGNVFSRMEKVENIGTNTGKDRQCTVQDIIRFGMDRGQHEHNGERFEKNGTDRDVLILLQRFIHPFHTDQVEKQGTSADQEERLFLVQLFYKEDCQKKEQIYDKSHAGIYDKNLMHRACQFFLAVTDLCTCADPIGGDPER